MLANFLEWLVEPLSIFMVGLTVILFINIFGFFSNRTRNGMLGVYLLVMMVFSSPIFANYLIWHLENARANPSWCEEDTSDLPIVVLGGGANYYINSSSKYDMLSPASMRRAIAAAKMKNEGSKFFLLGGGRGSIRESDLMAEVLIDFGIDQNSIRLDYNSRSTNENALALVRLLHDEGVSSVDQMHIMLVTSARHVLRASEVFEKQGFQVCHISAEVLYAPAVLPNSIYPYVDSLSKTTAAIHEYIGYFYYLLRSKI